MLINTVTQEKQHLCPLWENPIAIGTFRILESSVGQKPLTLLDLMQPCQEATGQGSLSFDGVLILCGDLKLGSAAL
jgi:hypothetical protein